LSDGQREETMPKTDSEAMVAEFIRTKGITRCPTACVLPTQGFVAALDLRGRPRPVAASTSRCSLARIVECRRPTVGVGITSRGFRTAKHPEKPLMRWRSILPVFAMRDAGDRVFSTNLIRGFCRLVYYAWPPIGENGDRNESTTRSKLWRITGFAI